MERRTESVEAVLETLISRGWRFRNPEEMRALIRSKASSSSSSSSDSIESELLSMDMRSFGGKSLPDPSSIKKFSHLQGPKVLQVVSVRDIYQSNIDASFRNSQRSRRLLRFGLTDGHSEVIAIEYASIPSITEDVIPGTKIRLENKVAIHDGILCLNFKTMTMLGGLVQSLYDEWQMSQKYSGFSRTSMRLSQNEDGVGPPPFEKLRIERLPYQVAELRSSPGSQSYPPESTSKVSVPTSGNSDGRLVGKNQSHQIIDRGWKSNDEKVDKVVDNPQTVSLTRRLEDKPSSSEARPKEVSEAVPVQNQAAAQKLLQKMSQPTHEDRHTRGHKHRFKGKQEEAQVFTLDEWERRKGSNLNPIVTGNIQDVSRDEELARKLQNQLDFEDFHGKTGNAEAEQIRMSMFSFAGAQEERNDGKREFGGRGRGRGRGKRRFG